MLRSATLIHPGTPLYFIVFTEFALNKDRIPFISFSAGQNIIQCRNAGLIFSFLVFLFFLNFPQAVPPLEIEDLIEEVRDGHVLLALLEVLLGTTLVSRFFCNVRQSFLEQHHKSNPTYNAKLNPKFNERYSLL